MRRHAKFGFLTAAFAVTTVAAEAAAQGEAGPSAPAAPAAPTLETTLGSMLGKPGGLLSDDVAKRTAATSFDLRARLSELDAAAAAVDEALIAYFPRLELTARYTRLSAITAGSLGNLVVAPGAGAGQIPPGTPLFNAPISFPSLLNQYTLQASLSLPLSDYLLRIPQAHAAATHSERSAALSAEATRLKAGTDGRVLYYTWVRAKLQLVVAEQALEQARAHLTDVRHTFDAGTASKADVLRLESQLASSQLVTERARNLAELEEAQLRITMHDPKDSPYEVGERVDEEKVPLAGGDITLSAMWAEARERRLEVKALSETVGSLEKRAKVARAGYFPRLDAFGDAAYANPNARFVPQEDAFKGTWDAGLQLTIVPNDMAIASTQGRTFDARVAQTIADREALMDGIRIEVTQARQDRREAEVALETTRTGLASAEESYRVRRALFQHGRATTVELTDAETDLTRARLDAINSRIDLRVATVRLAHALGRDIK
jgi:outer membrane protein